MKSLQGYLLLASPKLRDPNFAQSVVLIVQHDENGALGLIVNRPTETTLADAWSQVSETACVSQAKLFQGGPCEGPLMVLHGKPSVGQMEVTSGVYFSTEAESVTWLVQNEAVPAKYFVGYAGWSPGQLEAELVDTGWQVAPAEAEHIFDTPEDYWLKLTQTLARSRTYPQVTDKTMPTDPSMN